VNVVDSSAWLEYFGDGPNAQLFAKAIEKTDELVVPSLTLFEVFKRTLQLTDETTALNAVAVMMQGGVVDLSASLAIESARLSYVCPMGQNRRIAGPP
jgi:predicted nucleic acid-binding protein